MESRPAPTFSPPPRPAPAPQPAAALPYSEFSQMIENAGARGRRASCPAAARAAARARSRSRPAGVHACAPPPARRRVSISPRRPSKSRPARRPPGKLIAPPRYARRISARSHPAARDVALGAFRSAPARPDPRELHHRRRPRRPVDHRSARRPRAHSLRAGDEAARRRPRGDAAPADAADPATHSRAADRLRAHRRRTARLRLRDRALRQSHHRRQSRARQP